MLYCVETLRRIRARKDDERLSERGHKVIDDLEALLLDLAERHHGGNVDDMLKDADLRLSTGEPRPYMSETHASVIQERLLGDLIAILTELAGPEPGASVPNIFSNPNFLGADKEDVK